ncbi:PA5502 family lipoprotein [Pseudomonas izuensis]|uniref:PA5502 family lipoprotein n=1 Tax=Pseudomonas izuensis TaxID=2684212 RepID=UPI00135C2859|nr:PA5502 family lipoprotein [Pseudomonas izuensis]
MKSFPSRYLLLVAFSLLLGACQSTPPAATEAPDARATAIAQLEQSLASSELATAEDQLAALQAQSPNDQSLEQYQRQLAEAYLMRSQIVLQKGDVNAAATALARARALMPKAPALTGGVNGAIAQARKAELDKAEADLKSAEAKRKAKVIDPEAESTTVKLKITDMGKVRRQLDAIAADVVNFQCDVSIQVPRTDDYPWLANLLTKRVNKLDPQFDLKLDRQINRSVPAQMVLSPRKQP